MWAIIGGSGFEKFEEVKNLGSLDSNTPFGKTSTGIKKISFNNTECLFIPRHGEHHEKLPQEVNYRANIFALKRAGATKILSISAVGSLREELKPGDLVVPSQYMDKTKSLRPHTFCGNGLVGHVSLAEPVSKELVSALRELIPQMKASFSVHFNKTYICIEGPAFSTKAESNTYRQAGADIIGMTNFPEYQLAREAGLAYLPFCFVTDYDCWKVDMAPVSLSEVMAIMKLNNQKAFKVASAIIPATQNLSCKEKEMGLKNGLMTSPEHISSEIRSWLSVLF